MCRWGAFVLDEKAAEHSLVPGDHGTTYGGNPLACRAVSTVFDLYDSLKITEHVQKTAPYLEKKLDALVEKYDCFSGRRGKGFMQGLVVEGAPGGRNRRKGAGKWSGGHQCRQQCTAFGTAADYYGKGYR